MGIFGTFLGSCPVFRGSTSVYASASQSVVHVLPLWESKLFQGECYGNPAMAQLMMMVVVVVAATQLQGVEDEPASLENNAENNQKDTEDEVHKN